MDEDEYRDDATFPDDDPPARQCDWPRGWEPTRAFARAPFADERGEALDDALLSDGDWEAEPAPAALPTRLLTPEEFLARIAADRAAGQGRG